MKAALALLAAAPIVLAQAEVSEPKALDNAAYRQPPQLWRGGDDAKPTPAQCRDRVRRVRAENGQVEPRRETADPDKPLLIAAVDHRIDGCGVMVMRQDTSDVRPLPDVPEGPVRMIPAR